MGKFSTHEWHIIINTIIAHLSVTITAYILHYPISISHINGIMFSIIIARRLLFVVPANQETILKITKNIILW